MATYHYRCTRRGGRPGDKNCGKRVQLPHMYHEGAPELECPACGGRLKFDPQVKKQRQEQKQNGGLCHCDGYHFSQKGAPHRKGSKWCKYYTGEYTEEDYRYGPPLPA